MRIISQLVPNGKPVSTDIEASRQPGSNTWEIPAWGRPLALGVYPLFVLRNRGLMPFGTAFCISNLGVSMTALHNIRESFRRHWHSDLSCQTDGKSAHCRFKDAGMAIFHHRVLPAGGMSEDIVVFEFIDSVPPVDVGCVFPQFKTKFPYLPLPLSFNLPRIGSRVICVGFSDLQMPDGGFSLDDILSGRVNLLDLYEHRFLAVEGRVNRIFTKRFADGFIEGPCYTVDAEIKHGMCGGPVFSENGYVCGVTSAGATDFFGEPTSVISLLYPALVMNVRFGGRVGHVRINSNRRLVELIAQGGIITDGSEKFAAKSQEGGDALAGFAFHREDAHCIYDDLSAFRKGRHAAL